MSRTLFDGTVITDEEESAIAGHLLMAMGWLTVLVHELDALDHSDPSMRLSMPTNSNVVKAALAAVNNTVSVMPSDIRNRALASLKQTAEASSEAFTEETGKASSVVEVEAKMPAVSFPFPKPRKGGMVS